MATVEREVEFPAQGKISAHVAKRVKQIMENHPEQVAITFISVQENEAFGEFVMEDVLTEVLGEALAAHHDELPNNPIEFTIDDFAIDVEESATAKISLEES